MQKNSDSHVSVNRRAMTQIRTFLQANPGKVLAGFIYLSDDGMLGFVTPTREMKDVIRQAIVMSDAADDKDEWENTL